MSNGLNLYDPGATSEDLWRRDLALSCNDGLLQTQFALPGFLEFSLQCVTDSSDGIGSLNGLRARRKDVF